MRQTEARNKLLHACIYISAFYALNMALFLKYLLVSIKRKTSASTEVTKHYDTPLLNLSCRVSTLTGHQMNL